MKLTECKQGPPVAEATPAHLPVAGQFLTLRSSNFWQRWLLLCPASVLAFVVAQSAVSVIGLFLRLPIGIYLMLWAASDWAASLAFLLVASWMAPSKRTAVVLASTLLLTVWHTLLIMAAPAHPIAPIFSTETVQTTGVVGILITAAFAYAALKDSGVKRLRVIGTIPEAPSADGDRSDEIAEPYILSEIPSQGRFGAGDLLLLEKELRKTKLQPDEYMSAIQFAFAVEKDCGFTNCMGEQLQFNQIVLDSAMRVYVPECAERFWLLTANSFRNYEELTSEQRSRLIDAVERSLPERMAAQGVLRYS